MTQSQDGKDEKGALRVDQNQLINEEGFSFSGYERDPLYLNLGTKKFVDVSGVSGIDSITDGRAGVFADFDNDGDLDVFMTTIQGQSQLLFRNNVGQDNHYLRVALEGAGGGAGSSRDAFGAVVRVKTSAGTLTKIKSGGSGFISQHDPRLLFGLGRDAQIEWIEVTWPNGKVQRYDGEAGRLKANSTVLLRENSSAPVAVSAVGRAKLPDPLTRAELFARSLKIAVGKPLPPLALKAIAGGGATALSNLLKPGRRLLINVWATWCTPCAREMPELERLRARIAARGIDLIGLNVDTEPDADITGFVAEQRVRYPNYIGGVAAIEQLYATDELTVPLTILVDDKGVVTQIMPGWSEATQKRFEELAGQQEQHQAAPRQVKSLPRD